MAINVGAAVWWCTRINGGPTTKKGAAIAVVESVDGLGDAYGARCFVYVDAVTRPTAFPTVANAQSEIQENGDIKEFWWELVV